MLENAQLAHPTGEEYTKRPITPLQHAELDDPIEPSPWPPTRNDGLKTQTTRRADNPDGNHKRELLPRTSFKGGKGVAAERKARRRQERCPCLGGNLGLSLVTDVVVREKCGKENNAAQRRRSF